MKWKSAVSEIWNFGAVANVRTIEENYPLGRHSETHAKVVMKLFEAACCFCWCGVFMRQGDTHTFIAFYIMSFINWTTIFIVQIIIYFHLVSVLLHSCCITLISRSTCSFTDAGNFKWAVVLRQIFRQIVSIRVMTLINTNVVASRHIKREEVLLPVAVRRSKTPELKLNFICAMKTSRVSRYLNFLGETAFWRGIFCLEYPSRRSERVNCHFLNYRFSFRKLQIFIS